MEPITSLSWSDDSTTTAGWTSLRTRLAKKARSIAASDGDVLEFRYIGATVIHVAQVTVDAAGPKITNLSPLHNTRTNAGAIRFGAKITDSGVGIGSTADEVDATFTVGGAVVNPVATKPDEGSSTLARILAFGEGSYEFQVTARDALGNTETSEAVADDKETEDMDETVGPNTVIVDITGPVISSATTGVELGADEDDNPAPDPTGNRKAIVVRFLDGGADDVEQRWAPGSTAPPSTTATSAWTWTARRWTLRT